MKKPIKTAVAASKPARPPKPPRVLAPDGGAYVVVDGKPVAEEAVAAGDAVQPVRED